MIATFFELLPERVKKSGVEKFAEIYVAYKLRYCIKSFRVLSASLKKIRVFRRCDSSGSG